MRTWLHSVGAVTVTGILVAMTAVSRKAPVESHAMPSLVAVPIVWQTAPPSLLAPPWGMLTNDGSLHADGTGCELTSIAKPAVIDCKEFIVVIKPKGVTTQEWR